MQLITVNNYFLFKFLKHISRSAQNYLTQKTEVHLRPKNPNLVKYTSIMSLSNTCKFVTR